MNLTDLANLAQALGVVGLLVVALYSGYKRWWVWGSQYDAMVKDRDRWQDMAIRGLSVAERTTGVAEKALTPDGANNAQRIVRSSGG